MSTAFDLASVVFGVLLTALLAYALWLAQQWRGKKERRKNLATAMLVELWSLDWVLRLLANDEQAAISYGVLPSALFAEAHRHALEFPPDTVLAIMLFGGLCKDIDLTRARALGDFEQARESEDSSEEARATHRTVRRNHNVRAKAIYALSLVAPLKNDLQKLGGTWRERGPVPVTDGIGLPEIPPSPFGHRPELSG